MDGKEVEYVACCAASCIMAREEEKFHLVDGNFFKERVDGL